MLNFFTQYRCNNHQRNKRYKFFFVLDIPPKFGISSLINMHTRNNIGLEITARDDFYPLLIQTSSFVVSSNHEKSTEHKK